MFHFRDNPTCLARTSDTKARVSLAPDLETFQDCQRINSRYCAECAGVRTDSERYAELRALVEAWQHWQREPRYDQADAPERLMDWSHR